MSENDVPCALRAVRAVDTDRYGSGEEIAVSAHMLLPPGATAAMRGAAQRRSGGVEKRAFDLVCASLLLIASLPLWLIVAVLIRLTSAGPVLFRQQRVGKDEKLFTCFKFRTMVDRAHDQRHRIAHLNAMSGPVFKAKRDPRVTKIGRMLRKTSIDELPQLLNVLRGEMSVVGPRPALPEEVTAYTTEQRGRLSVKPGLTCLWQISGRSTLDFDRWIELDLEYVRRQSFWLDCLIVLQTVPAVLTGRGAY